MLDSIPVIVSVAPREAETHQRTFASLLATGFERIIAMCEPGTDIVGIPAECRVNPERFGNWRNFVQALRIGLSLNVPYFMTAEDDIELCRGVHDFLVRSEWPDRKCGCLSLYSSRQLENYPTGRRFRVDDEHALDFAGACAFMFSRDAAQSLLWWADNKGWKGHAAGTIVEPERKEAADTFVGEMLTLMGYSIWAHNPTLVNHIGKKSTMANHDNPSPYRMPLNFPGVDADLRTIFRDEIIAGYGNRVSVLSGCLKNRTMSPDEYNQEIHNAVNRAL